MVESPPAGYRKATDEERRTRDDQWSDGRGGVYVPERETGMATRSSPKLTRKDFHEVATVLREARARLIEHPETTAAWALYGVEVKLRQFLQTTNAEYNDDTFRDASRPHDWVTQCLALYQGAPK